ncbi:acyltransferase domain-containing protein [Nocardia sp. NPDC020380]|uniref:acyltransferase domain-containing protein n=1 Tax=Nocardia sp. NPDC020380 TaxID=3364309 RepID=UPI0037A0A57F
MSAAAGLPAVSIVGIGCRVTGADFDHEWFGIGGLEAAGMSGRQRANLEVAVEALDDSGLGCVARGSGAAVVFGVGGSVNSAHQLSRALELRGPSLMVDSDRTSPLVAVDMGVRLLADEAVPFVIAGGVDLALLPDISDLQVPVGLTGDSVCTVLVLQRTADARRTRTRRYAEIGLGGIEFTEARSSAHISLRDAVATAPHERGEEPPVLIPISGRDAAAVHNLALRWATAVSSYRTLREFGAATSRLAPETVRAAVLADDIADAGDQLRALARHIETAAPRAITPRLLADTVPAGLQTSDIVLGPVPARREGGVLLLFSGSGGHARMGRGLAARYPVFGAVVTAVADAVVEAGGPRVWTPRTGFGNDSGGAVFAHSALFAYQVALAELLDSWGIRPDAVAGYGAGEIAAAVVAGVLSLGDGARVAVARGRLLDAAGTEAAAAVLEATPAEAMRLVEPMRTSVAVAAVDGPTSITVSGEPRYVEALIRRAHRRAIFAQRAPGSAPHHLPRARTLVPQLITDLADLVPRTPDIAVYSTTHRGAILRLPQLTPTDPSRPTDPARSGEVVSHGADHKPAGTGGIVPSSDPIGTEARMDAAYWAANATGTVELAGALEQAVRDGISTVVEVAPHPVHAAAVREHVTLRESAYAAASREDEAAAFLTAVARLYLEGRFVDWTALGPHTTAPPRRQWRRPRGLPGERYSAGGQSDSEPALAPVFPVVKVRPEDTYVVADGLSAQGVVAVRWLLAAGALDVVVLTPDPQALPPPLDGMEDRIVVVRCDIADRADLATALHDIRECGSPIRGIVHAACEPPLSAAADLLELTAADPTDFTVLLTAPVPGPTWQVAHDAVRELAAAQRDRRVVCVEWEVGPAA